MRRIEKQSEDKIQDPAEILLILLAIFEQLVLDYKSSQIIRCCYKIESEDPLVAFIVITILLFNV